MSPQLRNILAVIAGVCIGAIVNSSIILLGPYIISAPEGVNPSDIESIKANIELYGVKHFIVPFLAHALGTFIGAFATVKIAKTIHMRLAIIVGSIFFIGGLMMAFILPAFWKFSIVDLLFAYYPVSYLAYKYAKDDIDPEMDFEIID